MKRIYVVLFAAILALIITACGGENATPSTEDIMASVNTAVALTNVSQPVVLSKIDTNVEANSVEAISTPTPFRTATLISSINTPTLYSSYSSGSACDNSAYISDVSISDGTILAPGETFTKTWRIKNTGTCTWNSNYAITFSSGNAMSGETTAIDQSVASNNTGDISVELTAPDAEGTYTGYWILQNSSGMAFGNYVYVQIVVSNDAATSTPTSTTESATSTSTASSTSTTAPTSTIAATNTSTETVEAATSTPEP
ncbi:MAG: NBR1-Ig-like domain-containing protein [Anaerolineales bacterium]